MQTGVAIDVLGVHVRAQLDQCLDILEEHADRGEVKSRRSLSILCRHLDLMASFEDENGEYTLVSLCSAVDNSLMPQSLLMRITIKLDHEHLDEHSVAGGCCQVDSLRPHVSISVLRHLFLVVWLVCHQLSQVVQNVDGLLEANELKQIHVVAEPEGHDLLLGHAHEPELVQVILLNKMCNFLRSRSLKNCFLVLGATAHAEDARVVVPTISERVLRAITEKL